MAPRRSLGHALGIPFRRSRGGIAPIPPNIITATVEDETPTKVYINFAWNLDDTSVPDPSAFTLAGKIISGVVITGATVTLTVTVAYVYGDVITVDYTMPGADPLKQESTGASILSWVGQVVTNYVHTPEVSTYIDGLVTPLSDGQLALLNTMLLYWKAGLGEITNLSEFADVLYDLAGETAESSLRNMVRRAHDAVAVNSPVFVPYEGFSGDGLSATIDTNYDFVDNKVNASVDSHAFGLYSRLDALSNAQDLWTNTNTTSGWDQRLWMKLVDGRTRGMSFSGSSFYVNNPNPSTGLYSISRVASNLTLINRNGTNLDTSVLGSGTITSTPNTIIYLLNGRQYSFYYYSRGLTEEEMGYLFIPFEAYMDSNGRGVIA